MKKVLLVLMALSLGVSASAAILDFEGAQSTTPVYSSAGYHTVTVTDDGSGTNNVMQGVVNGTARRGTVALNDVVPDGGGTWKVEWDLQAKYNGVNGNGSKIQIGLQDVAASLGGGGWDDWGPMIDLNSDAVETEMTMTVAVRDGLSTVTTTATVERETWIHMALVIDTNTEAYDLYIDSVLIGNYEFRYDGSPPQGQFGALQTLAFSNDDNKVWVDNIAVSVPEPATMVLLGLGSLMAIRRKK